MIQISSGVLKGILLQSPKGDQTRPTSQRIRQSIFNRLRNHEHEFFESAGQTGAGLRVIDCFAGTGAWGIEAASLGATEVVFVESHKLALECLSSNLKTVQKHFQKQNLKLPRFHIIAKEVDQAYYYLHRHKQAPYDLLFCDPPYRKGYFEKMLELEKNSPCLRSQGLFVYESASNENLNMDEERIFPFTHQDSKIYGDSAVHFFVKR